MRCLLLIVVTLTDDLNPLRILEIPQETTVIQAQQRGYLVHCCLEYHLQFQGIADAINNFLDKYCLPSGILNPGPEQLKSTIDSREHNASLERYSAPLCLLNFRQ